MPIDGFGRHIDYLRLSVTDRCNLRCAYCLPVGRGRYRPAGDLLSDDEIAALAARFAETGWRKIRITGGEPLVRPGLPELIGRLVRIPGIEEVSLTTNGMLLRRFALPLAAAGLARVNISLDTLRADNFRRLTRYGDLPTVLDGVNAALDAGLTPVKLNCVVARGLNDGELADFAALTQARPLHVRFIELMPMGETNYFAAARRVPLAEMMALTGPLEEAAADQRPPGHGPARYYRRPGAAGTVGFIGALSRGFCGGCNRVRLSAAGTLVACLDGEDGVDLRATLRAGAREEDIRQRILDAIKRKPRGHRMFERCGGHAGGSRVMCSIGG
ncbi:MAG: GTP 3',8-cyclase MoaA [Elusimicrobiota bacterium]